MTYHDLIADLGYTDLLTVVVKFCRGLDPLIQEAVAMMGPGRPSDSCPDQWYSSAWTFYEN
jgi:hypothetical protein